MERTPMTPEGYRRIEKEIDDLEAKRPALIEAIKTAREKGDLSENAEFDAAKEMLVKLENKTNELARKLGTADVVEPKRAPKGVVALGAKVRVLDLDLDEEEDYTLVGAGEVDVRAGKIPTTSPVGQGLLRKKVGDEVEIKVPRGFLRYRILAIEY